MSLINQVLKDLEQRREGPVSSADGSIVTMPRYTVARGDNPFVVYVFGALLIILSLVIGFLVWDRLAERRLSPVTSIVEVPTAAPATPVTIRPAAVSNSRQPARAETKHIEKTKTQEKVETPVKARPKTAPVAIPESEVQTEKTLVTGTIEKQRRPLTEKQLADQSFHKGYAALRNAQVQQGERFFRKALSSSPGHLKSREMLAGIYIKAGRYVEAAQLLKQGVAINPGHSMFRKLYARVLLEQDGLDQAVAVLERSLPQISQDVDYYALLAALYQRQGRHDNAVTLYQNMLKQNAMVGIWWIGMGISLEKLGDSDAARQAYEKARASGTLAAQMIQYTDNRLAALNEIGYPDE